MQTAHKLLVAAAGACAVASSVILTAGQVGDTGTAAGRSLAQPVSAAAIDRGVEPDFGPPPVRRRAMRAVGAGSDLRQYDAGRVLVKFKDGGTAASTTRTAVARAAGATNVERLPWADFDVLHIDTGADAEAVATTLAARDDVEYAQADYRIHPYFRPNDPLYPQQWNFPLIGMEEAWDINRGATSSVTVAVLDSGIAYTGGLYTFTARAFTFEGASYPALGRLTIPFAAAPDLGPSSRFVAPHDFIWNDDVPLDLDGHGTHVSGTIGQLTDNNLGAAGMAFNVRLMPVKCISSDWDVIFGAPEFGSDSVLARAIRYAADNGAKIINMSVGRNGPPAPAIGDAIRYAVGRGVFVAVAGGNDYEDGNPIEAIAEQAAPIEGAMVVAAVGPDRRRAYYSGVKPYIEIAAPGGDARQANGLIIQQTFDGSSADTFLLPPSRFGPPRFDVFAYRNAQGTSMAVPHVAGLAALLYSQGITKPAAIEAAIARFATDLGTPGRDNEYGAGLINPRNTLRGLGLIR